MFLENLLILNICKYTFATALPQVFFYCLLFPESIKLYLLEIFTVPLIFTVHCLSSQSYVKNSWSVFWLRQWTGIQAIRVQFPTLWGNLFGILVLLPLKIISSLRHFSNSHFLSRCTSESTVL